MEKSNPDQEKYYRELEDFLREDLPKMSRENKFAVYGYLMAFAEMGFISAEHFGKLARMLGIPVEELDELLL